MIITKQSIRTGLNFDDMIITFLNLHLLSKKYDTLTYAVVGCYIGEYAECMKTIKAKPDDITKQVNLLAKFPIRIDQMLRNNVLDTWSIEIDSQAHASEIAKLYANYPHLNEQSGSNKMNLSILFLAANPKDTPPLRIANEFAELEQLLESSENRDSINLEQRWATKIKTLQSAMLKYNPNILHFSGHGSADGAIILEDDEGFSTHVRPQAFSEFCSSFKEDLKCVVLNACFSKVQAEEIIKHSVPYVIGMHKEIDDKAAKAFSTMFYEALWSGKSIPDAFKLGKNSINMNGLSDKDVPVLLQEKGN